MSKDTYLMKDGCESCRHNWCLRGKAPGVHVSYCTICGQVRILTDTVGKPTLQEIKDYCKDKKIEVE